MPLEASSFAIVATSGSTWPRSYTRSDDNRTGTVSPSGGQRQSSGSSSKFEKPFNSAFFLAKRSAVRSQSLNTTRKPRASAAMPGSPNPQPNSSAVKPEGHGSRSTALANMRDAGQRSAQHGRYSAAASALRMAECSNQRSESPGRSN